MKILLYLALLFFPDALLAQDSKIIILDKNDHKPLLGISMLSENGSLIASFDEKGQIIFDLSSLTTLDTQNVFFYDTDY